MVELVASSCLLLYPFKSWCRVNFKVARLCYMYEIGHLLYFQNALAVTSSFKVQNVRFKVLLGVFPKHHFHHLFQFFFLNLIHTGKETRWVTFVSIYFLMTCHDRIESIIISPQPGHDISITVHKGMLTLVNGLWIIHLYKHVPFPDLRGCGKWISLTLKHDMSRVHL